MMPGTRAFLITPICIATRCQENDA